jgi:hypothetical protein
LVRLEIVEPARALPVLSPLDYRIVDAYAVTQRMMMQQGATTRLEGTGAVSATSGFIQRVFRAVPRFAAARKATPSLPGATLLDNAVTVTEILTPTRWERYEDNVLVAKGTNSLGILPLVHIQNTAVPFEYTGASDVEPLIALQDELNTRLSDRAHRVTLQSFKMYLGKGIDGFTTLPVAPGRMWSTDNDQASVIEFGGDANCPSEDNHIRELRDALDKTSGVTPIAAGAIKGRIGRLTSAAALRVTMLALLAKTEKKRTTYGNGIRRLCELSLQWLDAAGVFTTSVEERRIDLHWPSPIPENEGERLAEAEAKQRLGVPQEVILRELGY